MSMRQPVDEVRTVPAVVYTQNTRNAGLLRSHHFRFSDALNAMDQGFVLLHGVTIQPLHAAKGEEILASSVLIRKNNIVIGMPREVQAGVERPPTQQGLQVQRVPMRAVVEVWPFTVYGVLHLTPGVDLLQHVHDVHHQFMPVSDASVHYHPSPLLSFKAPFVMVNRERIEVVLDEATVGQRCEVDVAVVESNVVDTELSAVRAAELLAATTVFKGAHIALLQRVCAELCEERRISRKVCRAGAVIFCQGDVGDMLYVVESGKLEVYVTDRQQVDHHLAEFGPGDFFGEMAILGEGRRTATVRAATDASLMAVHEDAVKRLMQRFPSATTGMLSTMVRRQAGLHEALS